MTGPLLAFDTSGPWCSMAILRDGELIGSYAEEMKRGQAEKLMPLMADRLARYGLDWQDLKRIGVGLGPGNFTGIRISVSAARGLALGLGVPAVGVSTFEAVRRGFEGTAAVPGVRDTAYLQVGSEPPSVVATDTVPADARWRGTPEDLAIAIAWQAAQRPDEDITAPAPLYVRQADAAPGRDTPPRILDDA